MKVIQAVELGSGGQKKKEERRKEGGREKEKKEGEREEGKKEGGGRGREGVGKGATSARCGGTCLESQHLRQRQKDQVIFNHIIKASLGYMKPYLRYK